MVLSLVNLNYIIMLDFSKILADAEVKKQRLQVEQAKVQLQKEELCSKLGLKDDENLNDNLSTLKVQLLDKLSKIETEINELLSKVQLYD